jgi:hypothetical protein
MQLKLRHQKMEIFLIPAAFRRSIRPHGLTSTPDFHHESSMGSPLTGCPC